MRDPKFRQRQEDGLRAPHVAPINALVDELIDPSGRGWAPYVAPVYGGVNARVLNIHRDPGPKTNSQHGGSGFLCPENDDASAERFATLLDGAGIAVSETLSWNAYPWYINRLPRAAELEAAVEPLRRLLGLLPGLRVVMLHGGSARDAWMRLARRHPDLASRLEVVPTYHTSNQAFIGPPEVRAARMEALRAAFARTARILKEPERADVDHNSVPAMAGFTWSQTTPVDAGTGSSGWCLRDAVCQLMGWLPDSREWARFIEWPNGIDIPRLAAHLHLDVLGIQNPREWNDLIRRAAHPGVALFDLPVDRKSHVVYVHEVAWLLHHWPTQDGRPIGPGSRQLLRYGWPLDQQHLQRGVLLGAVIMKRLQVVP